MKTISEIREELRVALPAEDFDFANDILSIAEQDGSIESIVSMNNVFVM